MKEFNRNVKSSDPHNHSSTAAPVQKKKSGLPGNAKDSLIQRSIVDQAKDKPAAASGQSDSRTSMPSAVKAKMENSFGADFSNVNIHEGNSATSMNALAYTQGDNIHFAPGQYNPESKSGQELLGHELTHVVQQRQGNVTPTAQMKGVGVNDDNGLEKEADEAGKMASEGSVVKVNGYQSDKKQFKSGGNGSNAAGIDRTRFNQSVSDYCIKLMDLSNSQLDWFGGNMLDYVAATFTSPSNNFTSDLLNNLVKQSTQEAFDSVVFESLKEGVEKYLTQKVIKAIVRESTALGAGVAAGAVTQALIPVPVAGFAVGFVVAVLVDIGSGMLVNYFFENESNMAAIQGAEQSKELFKPYLKQISKSRNEQTSAIFSKYNTAIHNAGDGISNQDLLNQYTDIINAERVKIEAQIAKIDVNDKSLFKNMLNEWILSNVGDSNDEVNSYGATKEQFATNIKTMNGLSKGYSSSNSKITNQADAFAYQTRAELLRLGVNDSKAQQVCESYKKDIATYHQTQSMGFDRINQRAYTDTDYVEEQAYRNYNNKTLTIKGSDISDIKKFKSQVKETNDGWFSSDEEKAIDAKNFTLYLRHHLRLNLPDKVVTTDIFFYNLKTPGNSTSWFENV